MINLVFAGSSLFSLNVLKILSRNPNVNIQAILTKTAKVSKRGSQKSDNVVKIFANENGILCFEADKITPQLVNDLQPYSNCIFLTCSYGVLLSQTFLDNFFTINIHTSFLPFWRGASPMQAAILNNMGFGITLMQTIKELDAGPIIFQKRITINHEETIHDYENKAIKILEENLGNWLQLISNWCFRIIEQNPQNVKICTKINKEDYIINPSSSSSLEIFNKWRAFGFVKVQNFNGTHNVILHELSLNPTKFRNPVIMKTMTDDLFINKIQVESKKTISGNDYNNSYKK